MEKIAFKMKLKPGFAEEYKKRHDEIWPELKKALIAAGISDYSIYLDQDTYTLFAVQKRRFKEKSDQLSQLPVMKKWWEYMKDIMEVHPDNSPVVTPLEEVFHMD
jgi:L-rhamnose mutarotase